MNNFENAVNNTPEIKGNFKKGLQALGNNSQYVSACNNSLTEGSVDIDSATKNKYPTASRWDYAIGYNKTLYLIEVHPASSGNNADEMLKKFYWLKDWLSSQAPLLNAISPKKYRWANTGKVNLPNSQTVRKLQQLGLSPKGKVKLE